MEETTPLKRTQNERQKQKNMYINAILYNMLLHHDVVRIQVPFSLPPLLRVVLLYELYYSSTLTVNACQLLLFNPLRFQMAAAPSGWAL